MRTAPRFGSLSTWFGETVVISICRISVESGSGDPYVAGLRVALSLVCSVLLWPLAAAAEPTITWQAPTECPSASEARVQVARLLRKPLSAVDATLSLRIRIVRLSRSTLEASVGVNDGTSARERLLRDDRCDVLTHAVAVVVALAVDPAAAVTASERAPTGRAAARAPDRDPLESSLASAGEGDVSAPSIPQSAPAPTSLLAGAPQSAPALQGVPERIERSAGGRAQPNVTARALPAAQGPAAPADRAALVPGSATDRALSLAVGAGGMAGVLGPLAPTVSASIGILRQRWRAALRFGYCPSQHAYLRAVPSAGGWVSLASVAFDGGYRWHWGRFEIPLLVGLQTGFFTADGEGVAAHQRGFAGWLSTYAGSGVSFQIGRLFSLGLRANALVALRRPSFALENDTQDKLVFLRPGTFGGQLLFELETRLR